MGLQAARPKQQARGPLGFEHPQPAGRMGMGTCGLAHVRVPSPGWVGGFFYGGLLSPGRWPAP